MKINKLLFVALLSLSFLSSIDKEDNLSNSFPSPCSFVSIEELVDLFDLPSEQVCEASSRVIQQDSAKACVICMETPKGKDYLVEFILSHTNYNKSYLQGGLTSMLKSYEKTFEEITIFDEAIYVPKTQRMLIREDQYLIDLDCQGFSKENILVISDLILERLIE